jgi:EAL domain-containing protein (putative c-di-GMP-specific phosphodiesterase class I)
VLRCIAQPLDIDGTMLELTASVGVASAEAASTAEELLRNASAAMHTAKERGGASYLLYETSLRTQATARFSLENDLRHALERGQLHVEYQPVVDLPTGRIIGAEALLRWRHPEHGLVPPMTFIPIAERTALIDPIGQFVLKQACAQAARWHLAGYRIRVAVNVSGRQLLSGTFADQVAAVLADTGVDADQLCLELTESTLMDDVLRTATALHTLKALGISVSIDDFGTGYSSLAYLQRFPVDELKIDRSFINGLGQADDRNLVAAVIGIARALELHVVAEGVETEAQTAALLTLGCRSAQGFLFGRPQMAETLTLQLQKKHLNLSASRQD